MAIRAEASGVKAAATDPSTLLALSVLAGAFISFGAVFATTVSAGSIAITVGEGIRAYTCTLPYGVVRVLAGLLVSLGLTLAVIAGAELFSGSNMIVRAWASGKVRTGDPLLNWTIAITGNCVGVSPTTGLMFVTTRYTFDGASGGLTALATAEAKALLGFVPALTLGIMRNAQVCLAVWMCYSARTTVDRVLTIVPPLSRRSPPSSRPASSTASPMIISCPWAFSSRPGRRGLFGPRLPFGDRTPCEFASSTEVNPGHRSTTESENSLPFRSKNPENTQKRHELKFRSDRTVWAGRPPQETIWMTLPPGFTISPMREEEIAMLDDWAAAEGWNPGLSDLRIAWQADPDCFVALRDGQALAGGGSIFSYDGRFGFMGLFIIREDLRGHGLGTVLWHWRRDALLQRLEPGAAIGMDGVFDMVPFYERGGFKAAYRDLRFQGIASGRRSSRVISLSMADFEDIEAFDRAFVPAPRQAFLKGWLGQVGVQIAGIRESGVIAAYGVVRPCRAGFKIGPLFANRADLGRDVLGELLGRVAGDQVQIDVPEPNTTGLAMVRDFDLSMSFGCVRLYHGPDPRLPVDRIFGVTSLEFG